jgi:hypothetical protein
MFCVLMCAQAKAEGDAVGASAELAAERDSLAAELQQSQQALDSMQVPQHMLVALSALLRCVQCA